MGTSHGTSYRQEQWPTGLSVHAKMKQRWILIFSELQLARQLHSQEDVG